MKIRKGQLGCVVFLKDIYIHLMYDLCMGDVAQH